MPPYDHPWILTGQGTAGLEIAEQAKALGVTLDAVAAPCSRRRAVDRHRARREGASARPRSVHAGEPGGLRRPRALARQRGPSRRTTSSRGSICDALLAPTPGDVTFPLAQRLPAAPGLVVTDERGAATPWSCAFREFKLVVEPGGAVALAAALTGKLPVKGRAVAVVCSGGNVDHATFIRALSRRTPA